MSFSEQNDVTGTSLKKFKVVFLGDQSVGKSSIMQRYIMDTFSQITESTVGVDFQVKTLSFKGVGYKLHLWDTAGQERYKSIIPSYIKDCQVAIIVYDCTKYESFRNVDSWARCIFEQGLDSVVIGLLGNKVDLTTKEVTKEEGLQKAQELRAFFQVVSAKTGENIDSFFQQIIQTLDSTSEELFLNHNKHKLDQNAQGKNKAKKCC